MFSERGGLPKLVFLSILIAYNPDKPDWNGHNFTIAPPDDLVYLTECLLEKQEEFRQDGKSTHVDIGFRYTTAKNMHNVGTNGLVTRGNRAHYGVDSVFNGDTFGDGVYTANNPYAYQKFADGDQGLFVARLKGSTTTQHTLSQDDDCHEQYDTVPGRAGRTDEGCVLKKSDQVIALAQFDGDTVTLDQDDSTGNQMVHSFRCDLQAVVDECLNNCELSRTAASKELPSQVNLRTFQPAAPIAITGSTHATPLPVRPLPHWRTPRKLSS